jgi:lysozyme
MSWLDWILGRDGVSFPPPPPAPFTPTPTLDLPAPLPPVTQNAASWSISSSGLAFIAVSSEALRLNAYLDSAGIPTIGYGSIMVDGVKVKMGDTITPVKALECLTKDANVFVYAIRLLVVANQTQNQIDAMTSFTYNVGHAAFASSSLLKAINLRQRISEDLFTRWNKVHDPKTHQIVEVPGLTARRKREFTLYIT